MLSEVLQDHKMMSERGCGPIGLIFIRVLGLGPSAVLQKSRVRDTSRSPSVRPHCEDPAQGSGVFGMVGGPMVVGTFCPSKVSLSPGFSTQLTCSLGDWLIGITGKVPVQATAACPWKLMAFVLKTVLQKCRGQLCFPWGLLLHSSSTTCTSSFTSIMRELHGSETCFKGFVSVIGIYHLHWGLISLSAEVSVGSYKID